MLRSLQYLVPSPPPPYCAVNTARVGHATVTTEFQLLDVPRLRYHTTALFPQVETYLLAYFSTISKPLPVCSLFSACSTLEFFGSSFFDKTLIS